MIKTYKFTQDAKRSGELEARIKLEIRNLIAEVEGKKP